MSNFVKLASSLSMLRNRNLDPAKIYAKISAIGADAISERDEGLNLESAYDEFGSRNNHGRSEVADS
jgi:hypothetical protein